MKANKIVINDEVALDLTSDTVTEDKVKEGITFHKADGSSSVGTNTDVDVSDTTADTNDVRANKKYHKADGSLATGRIPVRYNSGTEFLTVNNPTYSFSAGIYDYSHSVAIPTNNIIPENIKKDVNILGVEGTLEEGIDVSDTTATMSDVLKGKNFYDKDGYLTEGLIETKDVPYWNTISDKMGNVIFGAGYYPNGAMVALDATSITYLKPENIKKDIEILGVTGTNAGVDVSSTTATAADVALGKWFFAADGTRVHGDNTNNADTRQDTIKANGVAEGMTFHDSNGVAGTGTLSPIGISEPVIRKLNDVVYYYANSYNTSNVTTEIGIHPSAKATIIPENIKKGVDILGVTGTFAGSSGSGMTPLWENHEFNRNFADQTVELDLSDYDAVTIMFTNNNTATTAYITKHFIYKNTAVACTGSSTPTATSMTYLERLVTVTDSGVTFSVGRTGGNTGNANMIPIAIYGVKSSTPNDICKVAEYYSSQLGISNYVYSNNEDGTFNVSWDLSSVSGYEGISLQVLTPRYPEAHTYRISMSVWHNCSVTTGTTKAYWGLALATSSELQTKHTVPFGPADEWTDLSIEYTTATSSYMAYNRQWLIFALAGLGSAGRFEIQNVKVERIS